MTVCSQFTYMLIGAIITTTISGCLKKDAETRIMVVTLSLFGLGILAALMTVVTLASRLIAGSDNSFTSLSDVGFLWVICGIACYSGWVLVFIAIKKYGTPSAK